MGLSGRVAFALSVLLFSLVLMIVGSIYLNDCPAEKNIPIFLIVAGITGILLVLLSFLQSWCYDEDKESDLSCWRVTILIIMLFWSAWLVAGSFWVYSNYQPSYSKDTNEEMKRHCDKVLYLFSFWAINLIYMFFVIFLIAAVFLYLCMPDIWSQIWGY